MTIIEEHEMIDLITQYLYSDSIKPLVVGGMIGTRVFDYVMEMASEYTEYSNIRIIEGIQDYIGMHDQIPFNNHNFYAEIFDNETREMPRITIQQAVDADHNFHEFPVIKKRCLTDLVIINDGHMIPKRYMDQIIENVHTKMIIVVDPFDINGQYFSQVPTVVKTLHKLSNLMEKARAVYNVSTDIVDKKVYSIFDKSKLRSRSYGKIDDSQYVTNDETIISNVRTKQIPFGFRKNQRLIVQDEHIIRSLIRNPDSVSHEYAITKNSIIQVMQGGSLQSFKHLRIYYSKEVIVGRPTFEPVGSKKGNIHVKPANILNVSDAMNHRFKHLIYIPGNSSISKREFYSMLKSTNHLTIIE